MHRRFFINTAIGYITSLFIKPPKRVKLICDYLSKDPSLYRTLVLTTELTPDNDYMLIDSHSQTITLLDVKRAWLLDNDRLELERYCITSKEQRAQDKFNICEKNHDGSIKTKTTILVNWVVRHLDKFGQTIAERHPANIKC